MNNKLIFFKAPTCGPCKMFYPQVVKAAETLSLELITIDVTEDTDTPVKYNINSSGTLILIDNSGSEIKRWERPMPASQLIQEIQ